MKGAKEVEPSQPTAGNAVWRRPPLTERALGALTDRAASRLAHTLSKYVSPSVGTKCGSRPYSICRTAPDGVVIADLHDTQPLRETQEKVERSVLRRNSAVC